MRKGFIALALLLGSLFGVMALAPAASATPAVAAVDISGPAAKKAEAPAAVSPIAKKAEAHVAAPQGYRGWWCKWANQPWTFTFSSTTAWWNRFFYGTYSCLDGLGFYEGQTR